MSEKLKEALSAVIDGEADEFELRRVLDEIGKDPTLAHCWERYHLIGPVLRGEWDSSGTAMRERIWAELQATESAAEEPLVVPEGRSDEALSRAPRLGRWTSLAVAAMVVLGAVMFFGDIPGPEGEPGPTVAAVSEPAEDLEESVGLSAEVRPSDRTRVDAYKLYHLQQLGMNEAGFGGFAKMVAYERD
jgi:sigma-E factor negative regulatory protein RseA